jgi:hypothetical protein
MVGHLDEEVRHDVSVSSAVVLPPTRYGWAFKQFDFQMSIHFLPCVPDRQGLLLNMKNHWAGDKRDGCRTFELTLATD